MTDSFRLKREMQMFMYMNRFEIHRQIYKAKTEEQHKLSIKFQACESNKNSLVHSLAQ